MSEPARQPPKLIRVYDDDGRELWIHDPEDPEYVPPPQMEPWINFEPAFQLIAAFALIFGIAWLLRSCS